MSPKNFRKISHSGLEISLYLSIFRKEVSQLTDTQTDTHTARPTDNPDEPEGEKQDESRDTSALKAGRDGGF